MIDNWTVIYFFYQADAEFLESIKMRGLTFLLLLDSEYSIAIY